MRDSDLGAWLVSQGLALDYAEFSGGAYKLHEAEARWDETRGLLDSWKDRHNALEIEKTQVDSDLRHLAENPRHRRCGGPAPIT